MITAFALIYLYLVIGMGFVPLFAVLYNDVIGIKYALFIWPIVLAIFLVLFAMGSLCIIIGGIK